MYACIGAYGFYPLSYMRNRQFYGNRAKRLKRRICLSLILIVCVALWNIRKLKTFGILYDVVRKGGSPVITVNRHRFCALQTCYIARS